MRSLFLVVPLLLNCNPSNTQDACFDIAQARCHRLFDLASQGCAAASDVLATQSITSESECESAFTFHNTACAKVSTTACAPDEYNGSTASSCASTVSNFSCEESDSVGLSADFCSGICCTASGNLQASLPCCSGGSHAVQMTSCIGTPFVESVCD